MKKLERKDKGAYFFVLFKDPGYKFSSYQWIQTVSSSPTLIKGIKNPHLDGNRLKDGTIENYPFYWNKSDKVSAEYIAKDNNFTTMFEDWAKGQSSFHAELTLVGINQTGQITPLGSFTWGYTNDNGRINLIKPIFSITPSAYQNRIIKDYNLK